MNSIAPFTTQREALALQDQARRLVSKYYEHYLGVEIPPEEVFVVWFCKTLQNWKAMVATTQEDAIYFEVTYDGDKRVTYLDVYDKIENIAIPDENGFEQAQRMLKENTN